MKKYLFGVYKQFYQDRLGKRQEFKNLAKSTK